MAKTWDPEDAEKAGAEFKAELKDDMTVAQLRVVWTKYFMRAGHKVLARILIAKDKPVLQPAVDVTLPQG